MRSVHRCLKKVVWQEMEYGSCVSWRRSRSGTRLSGRRVVRESPPWEMGRGDCPKTKNQILKVGTCDHNSNILQDEVEISMHIETIKDTRMENDGRSKIVFGQPEGGRPKGAGGGNGSAPR